MVVESEFTRQLRESSHEEGTNCKLGILTAVRPSMTVHILLTTSFARLRRRLLCICQGTLTLELGPGDSLLHRRNLDLPLFGRSPRSPGFQERLRGCPSAPRGLTERARRNSDRSRPRNRDRVQVCEAANDSRGGDEEADRCSAFLFGHHCFHPERANCLGLVELGFFANTYFPVLEMPSRYLLPTEKVKILAGL